MSTDPLTGLPLEFVRILAVKVDPYADSPNKPLDDFFAALQRAQSFRHGGKLPGPISATTRPKEGRSS